jgi:hypothetical protein
MLDFSAVESLLTPEQRAIRDAVCEFVDAEIVPNVRDGGIGEFRNEILGHEVAGLSGLE